MSEEIKEDKPVVVNKSNDGGYKSRKWIVAISICGVLMTSAIVGFLVLGQWHENKWVGKLSEGSFVDLMKFAATTGIAYLGVNVMAKLSPAAQAVMLKVLGWTKDK